MLYARHPEVVDERTACIRLCWRIPDELWQKIEPLLPKRHQRAVEFAREHVQQSLPDDVAFLVYPLTSLATITRASVMR